MNLQSLKENWHTTNSDLLWNTKYTFEDKIGSITYYIKEYIDKNSALHRNFKNDHLKLMLSGIDVLGIKGIRESNRSKESYFESKNTENGIKHTIMFSEYTGQSLQNQRYQRAHQFSAKRLRKYLTQYKVKLSNLEYFIALIYIMENSCIYAPRDVKKEDKSGDILTNTDFEIFSSSKISKDHEKDNIIYCKKFNQNNGKVSSFKISIEEFIQFQKDLKILIEFLLSKSFGIENENSEKYQSLSHAFHHHSSSISTIDNASNPFLNCPDNIFLVKDLCFDILI